MLRAASHSINRQDDECHGVFQSRKLLRWRHSRQNYALHSFEHMLSLNPNDNQGIRACWDDVRNGRGWEETQALEERQGEPGR